MANMGLPLFPFTDFVIGEHFNRQIMEGGRLPVYTKVSETQAAGEDGLRVDIPADEQCRSNDGRWLQSSQLWPGGDMRPDRRK